MLKGLSSAPKPFLKSVILENSSNYNFTNKTQADLYYDNPELDKEEKNKIRITLDFYIKALANYSPDNSTLNGSLKNILSQSYLIWVPIANKQSMLDFLKLKEADQKEFVRDSYLNPAKLTYGVKLDSFFNKERIQDYISIVNPKSLNDNQQRMLTIPVRVDKVHNYVGSFGVGNFLGYIYFLGIPSNDGLVGIVPNSIGTEIIFDDGQPVRKSGAFVIDKTFIFDNIEQELTKAPIPESLDLINPSTGESIIPGLPTDRNQQVNYLYGAPDDTWAGPIHFRMESNTNNPNFGLYRAMAGAEHDNTVPHPFLKYIIKGNNKIIDFRSIGAFEDLFSYKSSLYESILAASSNVLYTGQKKNKFIDDFIQKKGIVSEAKYSIRRNVSADPVTKKETEFRAVTLFFAVDKKAMLMNTTKVPSFLENLIGVSAANYNEILKNINIIGFEIIRKDKRNKTSKVLLTSPNDKYHVQLNQTDVAGLANEKRPVVFINKTNQILLSSGNAGGTTSLYEVLDSQINPKYDNGEYSYKIKIRYKDPVIDYLNSKLLQIKDIIANLDELSQKTSFMFSDPLTGKQVAVYDRFQKELNPVFVQQTLDDIPNKLVPLSFSFNKQSELPDSVEEAFPEITLLNSLTPHIITINSYFFTGNEQQFSSLIEDITMFFRSSLKLSITTPELIEKSRALLDLVRVKTEDLVALYTTQQNTKKNSGFTSQDYIKATNVKNSEAYIVEFEHEFENSLKISKTKNFFDWVGGKNAEKTIQESPIRQITVDSYKQLVNPNIAPFPAKYLTDAGIETVGGDDQYSYPFMLMPDTDVLRYENSSDQSFENNYYRAIRNKLFHNITNTPQSVLVPEILGTFGITFKTRVPEEGLKDYISDTLAYDKNAIPGTIGGPGFGIPDNFGTPFVESWGSLGGGNVFGSTKKSAFGSVDSSYYEWAGTSLEKYPYTCAISLVNLINTNVYKRKNIKYLYGAYKDLVGAGVIEDPAGQLSNYTNNKNVPHIINILSSEYFANGIQPNILRTDIYNNIFTSTSKELILQNYYKYSRYLNIIAKVYYLHGFEERSSEAFSGDKSKFSKFTNDSAKFIKSMDWRPLDAGRLDSLRRGDNLLCKVMLFDDVGAGLRGLLDEKVVDLFEDFYNMNKLFIVGRPGATVQEFLDNGGNSAIGALEEELQLEFGKINTIVPSGVPSISSFEFDKDIQTFNEMVNQAAEQWQKDFKEKIDKALEYLDETGAIDGIAKRMAILKALKDGSAQKVYTAMLANAFTNATAGGRSGYVNTPLIIGGKGYQTWLAPAGSRSTISFSNTGPDKD